MGGEKQKEGKKEKTKGIWSDKHRWTEGELEPREEKKYFVSTFESHIIMPT